MSDANKRNRNLWVDLYEKPGDKKNNEFLGLLRALVEKPDVGIPSQIRKPSLLVRNPHWPIEELLFITRGNRCDLDTLEWVILLAKHHQSVVNLLVVNPDVPGFYNRYPDVQLDIHLLLSIDSETSSVMKTVIHRIGKEDIPFEVRIRKAAPNEQIRQEVEQGNYHLVVISKECRGWLWRLFFGELIRPMLRWIDCPVMAV